MGKRIFKNKVVITVDVDWIADEVIEYVANFFRENKLKSSWFITHDSPAIRELFRHPEYFEVGIHPNFMPGSTQGSNVEDVMNYFLKI